MSVSEIYKFMWWVHFFIYLSTARIYQGIQSKLLIKWGKNIEAKHAFTDKCHTKFTSSLSCYVGNVYLIIHVITVSYKTVPRLQSKNFIPDGDILAILSENTAISEEICEMSKCY